MTNAYAGRKRIRRSFGKIPNVIDIPNLIEVQKASYDHFLQINHNDDTPREIIGLEAVFRSIFPIDDFTGSAQLDYVSYSLDEPSFDEKECQQRDLTYAAPVKVKLRLIIYDVDEESDTRTGIKEMKEQEVYMGDLPLMTRNGTFIINGTERVVVSQMHRSPGVFFDHDKGKTHQSGKLLFSARVIPYRGSWLDFDFDPRDILYVRIDRRRKLPVTVLLHALGLSSDEILNFFYDTVTYTRKSKGWEVPFVAENHRNTKTTHDIVDSRDGKVLLAAGEKPTARMTHEWEEDGLKTILISDTELFGRFIAEDIVDSTTGEIYVEAGKEINEDMLTDIFERGFKKIDTLDIDPVRKGPFIRNTLAVDKSHDRLSALEEIYRVVRPGEPPTRETAEALFQSLFFDPERYDLSSVGRAKMNIRLDLKCSDDVRTLRKEDLLSVVRTLVGLRDGKGEIDDIDNLGNRRVRSVGELMENQFRLGLSRMERSIKERMNPADIATLMPQDLINAKPVSSAVRDFFSSSQLSQFMDQTNPLAEITHKRRLSALGPGGLTRERAGFEVRDVHPTHYGRICPIETPEGPNIGLINSLATFARVNKYGFIESPYRKVENGIATGEVVYLSALEEARYRVAQANINIDTTGRIMDERINCRYNADFELVAPEQVDFIDVSPKQIVSVATALIPFLENDDANRALMGSNMQRQAVPLLRTEAPLVGTGMEEVVARDSGAAITANRSGIVDQVDATRIVIRATDIVAASKSGVDIYNLRKFQRSNQSTCINQRPIVRVGDLIEAGDVIADGPSTDLGDLALGRNVLVAFMPWNGYNYEDSILISERIVRDDVFTSIHIEEFEIMARDTKLGSEEITRDIPNVGEEALRNLDEVGIVYIGAEVHPGDILVGKVTPKGESIMTPEEKLLRAIFGEKASDVRDASLRLPSGTSGTVVEVRVFNRHGVEKDERAMAIEREEIENLAKDRDDERSILQRSMDDRLTRLLMGKHVAGGAGLSPETRLTQTILDNLGRSKWWDIILKNDAAMSELETLRKQYEAAMARLETRFADKVDKLQRGDGLPPGVMKAVKIFVAVKRKLQPGDKMAGRHGNKGVISRIAPMEDMPHLDDGTPVDVVLNPLGVPSRMNVGQILETHLGWACSSLGRQINEALVAYEHDGNVARVRAALDNVYSDDSLVQNMEDGAIVEMGRTLANGVPIATPVFDGARESDIVTMLEKAGIGSQGQVYLHDGRTGEVFDRPVTVGCIYILKLHHLVDDKIHARSTGPYSLVTQQPLGGKAQFGGQRFGEMEVWALEAYGAAYTLQEMLTIKSDDVAGRNKVYDAIVRGENNFEAGIPESFNVLIKEIRSLGLNIELQSTHKDAEMTGTADSILALDAPEPKK